MCDVSVRGARRPWSHQYEIKRFLVHIDADRSISFAGIRNPLCSCGIPFIGVTLTLIARRFP